MQVLNTQIQGDTKTVLFTVQRSPDDPNDWTDSTVQMVLASSSTSGRSHITTIASSDRPINDADTQQFTFEIQPSVTAAIEVPISGLQLIADLEITAPGNSVFTAQARWVLYPQVPTA
jgi:hypothetical protein